jgi:hypothetical protein
MSQPTGYPGGGVRLSKECVILSGAGSPNASTTPDVAGAQQGSLFLQTDVAGIYLCTASATFQNGLLLTASTWTQVTVP